MPRLTIPQPASSEITPSAVFAKRRQLLLASAGSLIAQSARATPQRAERFGQLRDNPLSSRDKLTPYESVTSYGNFYEFGPDKDSPAKHAHRLQTRPWTVTIDGEVKHHAR